MKNWRTTVCGLLIAAATAVQNYTGQNTWQGYAAAIGFAALGFLSKDFNVSGTGK